MTHNEKREQEMPYAVSVTLRKCCETDDPGVSKFFGTPTIPHAWLETFDDDELFFCQLRLSELAAFDTDNRLPHTGYMYVFLRTADGPYHLLPDVRYYDGEPDTAVDDFNTVVCGYERFTQGFAMTFERVDDAHDGTKLFGVPNGWQDAGDPPSLLLQYDPLDNDTGFLDSLDGYLRLFFGDDATDFDSITLKEDYS